MIGVVNCPSPFKKVFSRKTLPNRSCQGPSEAVWVGGVAISDQILPCQPWFWAGGHRHGGGGCQGRRQSSTIVVLGTKLNFTVR